MSNDWEYDYRGSHGPQTKRYPWGEDLKHGESFRASEVSVEELYQAFKERLMAELEVREVIGHQEIKAPLVLAEKSDPE